MLSIPSTFNIPQSPQVNQTKDTLRFQKVKFMASARCYLR